MGILELKAAKAQHGPLTRLWSHPSYLAEEKCDGWRYLMHFGGGLERAHMVSRKGFEAGAQAPSLHPTVDVSNVGYTVLDGEVIPPPGFEFSRVASYMKATDPLCLEALRKRQGELTYVAFDLLWVGGVDVRTYPLTDRMKLLNVVLGRLFPGNSQVRQPLRATDRLLDFFKGVLLTGGEGVILKDKTAPYGKRWVKAKRCSTLDVVIAGFLEGYGQGIGSFKMAVKDGKTLVPVGHCGFAQWQLRQEVNKNPEAFLGAVAEVKCLKRNPRDGCLREARLFKLRPDLTEDDCTLQKLERDLMKVEIE